MRLRSALPLAIFFFFAVLLLGTLPCQAHRPPDPPDRTSHPLVERFLDSKPGDTFAVFTNGLTLLVRSLPGTQVVSSRVYVRAGSIYEGAQMGAGLSHYLEHVVAGGTTRSFSEEQARQRLERLGGASNAYTSHDRTVYYITTTASHWKESLDLLLSYVSECALAPKEVAREKAVILQEIRMGQNEPGRELWKLFMKTAYRVHPVRHPVIGYEDVFARVNRKQLQAYYQARYQPQNMVVAVAGPVDPDQVIAFVADKIGQVPRAQAPPVVLPPEPRPLGRRWVEKPMPSARMVHAMVGFRSVPLAHEDLYALDVLSILMGDGRTSRLYQRLKEKDNLVLSVGAFNWTPAYVPGQWVVSLTLPPDNWPRVFQSLDEELEAVRSHKVSRKELEKAKKKVIADHVFAKETAEEMASSLASSYFDTGDPYFDEDYVDGIRQVTREDILRVARRYLTEEAMTVAAIVPASPPQASAAVAPPPPARQAKGPSLIRLPNGLRVLLQEDHRLPTATLQLYGLGGLLLEEPGQEGLAALTASLLTAGTKKRNKLEIAQALEAVGGHIASGSQNNTYFVTSQVLSSDVNLALDILADVITHPTFPREEIRKKKHETLQAIQRQDEDWQMELVRLFKKAYFSKHPYGHDRLGTVDSVSAFTRQDVLAFYRKMVTPQTAVLAVYGDFDSERLLKRIRKVLGSWTAPTPPARKLPLETHPLQTSRPLEKQTDKTSVGLFVGTNGLDLRDPRRPVLDVLDAVLSGIGYPGGRLHQALRGGTNNLVYVVHGFPFYGLNGGFFGVITQTTLDNAPRVEQIVLTNLEKVTREEISPEELERAKDMVITMHALDLEGLPSRAQSAAVNEVLGLGFDYDQRYPERVRKVTAQEVRRLAKELFSGRLIVRTIPRNPAGALPLDTPRPKHRP
ncbi:zinc protease [Desulfacinum hydrothermale DSM 13146]|uniref:Zinc protease n=1 Tax=Desulfacinum hydrothermale DSM 13146 TaxID=1121390 RepID=A0A1W1XUG2_9BACT|nr:pitrilysin family protein [Desulfacinum hydrothermale]SMC27620.1 zinc protease [Desulfacinum hydrothermale DSM 13146]